MIQSEHTDCRMEDDSYLDTFYDHYHLMENQKFPDHLLRTHKSISPEDMLVTEQLHINPMSWNSSSSTGGSCQLQDINASLYNKKVRIATMKKKARKLRLEKSLRVPISDMRRSSSKLILDCFHNSNFEKLRVFLRENAFEYLLFKYQSTASNPESIGQVILPNNMDIRGIDTVVSFVEACSKAKPDQIFLVSETIIKNTNRSCSITASFTAKGTCVYDILMERGKPEDQSRCPKNSRRISALSTTITNITNLRETVSYLDISPSTNDETIRFSEGSRLKSMIVNEGVGTLSIHFLNNEMKIHLIEFKVHYEDSMSA